MDDDLAFASHITKRGRIYQYIRRVPDDLADVFPFARIQRSLRTSDRAAAYAAASHVHAEFEKHFTVLRRKKGAAIGIIPTDDWTWSDWSQLAEWFKATLIEDDWRARLKGVSGAVFDAGAKPKQFWRDDLTVSAHLDLRGQLSQMTLETYGQERFNFVQSAVRPLGVPLRARSRTIESENAVYV
jgi:hypothetical protein